MCEQAAKVFCKKLFECAPPWGEELYGTRASCELTEAADCQYLAEVPGVSAQTLRSWVACDNALGARSCDQWRFGGPVEACRFPPGARKVGAGCSAYAQCATSYCRYNPSTRVECGSCAAPPKVGEKCDEVNGCAFGLACIEMPEPDTNQLGHFCVQPVVEGGACAQFTACQGDLVCVEGHCARPLSIGKSCTDAYECDGDLRCVQGKCADPLPAGAPCFPDEQACGYGLTCYSGSCEPLRPSGSACQADEQCWGFCSQGTCEAGEPPAGIGEECAPDVSSTGIGPECSYNAFCEPGTRSCVLRKPPGQPCSLDGQCLSWLACRDGKCAEPPVPMCGG